MGVFEKPGWYRLTIPEGWEADGTEDPAAIARAGGAGALQVTAQAPPPLKPGERIDVFLLLRAYLRGIGVALDRTVASRSSARGLDWAASEYVGDDPQGGRAFWRLWMATNHRVLVFLTYACPEGDRDLEREAVDGIVGSLDLS